MYWLKSGAKITILSDSFMCISISSNNYNHCEEMRLHLIRSDGVDAMCMVGGTLD